MSDLHRHYLADLGLILKEEGLKARVARLAAGASGDSFEAGRALAYYEVLSLMQQQALMFGLPLEDVRLEGLDPERDLL